MGLRLIIDNFGTIELFGSSRGDTKNSKNIRLSVCMHSFCAPFKFNA